MTPTQMVLALLLGMFVFDLYYQWRLRKNALSRLAETWGLANRGSRLGRPYGERDARDLDAGEPVQGRWRVDDQTWRDLLLEDVLRAIDYTQTGVGAQSLYFALRRPPLGPEVGRRRNEAARAFLADTHGRVRCQEALAIFGDRGWGLPSILWGRAPEFPLSLGIVYVMAIALPMTAALGFYFSSPALYAIAAVNAAANGVLHSRISYSFKTEIDEVTRLGHLIRAARHLHAQPLCRGIGDLTQGELSTVTKRLGGRATRLYTPMEAGILAQLANYAATFTLTTVIALMKAVRLIDRTREELQHTYDFVGEVDLRIALAHLKSDRDVTEVELSHNAALDLRGGRHPLVADCVANDLRLEGQSLLVTGSNMAGKSTFLRMVGTNAVLAQSLGLAFCERYRAPPYRVFTSMNVGDNLVGGKSRYRAEAERVLEILEANAEPGACLHLIDEVFSGTNPVERTAASWAVAQTLARDNPVIIATHDLELVDTLIAEGFLPVFFSESVGEEDVVFDYRLRQGVVAKPNALAILGILGYPKALVADAKRFADAAGQRRRQEPS